LAASASPIVAVDVVEPPEVVAVPVEVPPAVAFDAV
jgi:hypothetical protein